MAIVTGPLFSLEARGKIGNIMVHFPWKGRKVVRQWLKPTNPRDVDQKIIRQKLAAMGKNLVVIETPKTGLPGGSKMYQLLVPVAGAGQIWNATFAKQTLDYVKTDANYVSLLSELTNQVTNLADWQSAAVDLGMETLTGPQFATAISPEMQLFMGAYAAYKLELESYTESYAVHPSFWSTEVITAFVSDYQTTM